MTSSSYDSKKIDLEAAEWAIRLNAGPLDLHEQADLDAWTALSPRHRGALIRARASWSYLDRYAALAGRQQSSTSMTVQSGHSQRRWFLAASIVALLALSATYVWYAQEGAGETYTSALGQVRPVILTDGSRIVLNTDSKIGVRFSHDLREVRLLQGEAMFDVAQDPARPFFVRADDVMLKAIGTAFTVRKDNARVEVMVTEGVVEVAQDHVGTHGAPSRVVANQQLTADHTHLAIETLDHDKANRRLAWRGGMLAFRGEPLSVAVEEINRHNRKHIVIDDPQLAARPIVGIFRTTDVESFASSAAAAFDAQVEEGENAIHLKVRPASR